MGYNKKHMDVVAGLWDKSSKESMICPKCQSKMILIQTEPMYDAHNAYVPYDSIVECTKCNYQVRTESFTILGGVKDFNLKEVEIASWSPSGSRVISRYEHLLDFDLLKKIKKKGELVEFLIINNRVIQVI